MDNSVPMIQSIDNDYLDYTPPTSIDGAVDSKTTASIPTNPIIESSGPTVLPPEENVFNGKYFQWLDPNKGGTGAYVSELIKEKDAYFVVLETGERLSIKQLQQQMIEIDPPSDYDLDIKPNEYHGQTQLPTPSMRHTSTPKFDPVMEILSKKKQNLKKVDITLELDIPPKELYVLLAEGYEDGEDKIIDYLFTDDNVKIMKNNIKSSLKKMYDIEIVEVPDDIALKNEEYATKETEGGKK